MENDNLRKKIEEMINNLARYASKEIDRAFQNFAKLEEKGLANLTYSQMTEIAYIMGRWHGTLDCGKDVFEIEPPDYSKSMTRIEIMKDKLYKAAERKSIGLG